MPHSHITDLLKLLRESSSPCAIEHVEAAAPTLHLIVLVQGSLALACILAGLYAIAKSATGSTKINIFGARVSTQNVGVAFAAVGVVMAYFAGNHVTDSVERLAALPSEPAPVAIAPSIDAVGPVVPELPEKAQTATQ